MSEPCGHKTASGGTCSNPAGDDGTCHIDSHTPKGAPVQDQLAEDGADLILEADDQLRQNREEQHELLKAVSEEDGAPLLETRCEIYGHVVPVSGRLTGAFVERMEELDAEAKRRANQEGEDNGVSDIIRELTQILDELIDDSELTADGLYQMYLNEGVQPVRTIVEGVMDALQKEDERKRGTADGFRKKPKRS